MSRTRRVLHGLGFGLANQALVTLVSLWLTPFLLAHLGDTRLGLWIVVAQLLAYLTLLDVGVIAILPRETAYAVGRAQEGRDSEVPVVMGRALGMLRWQLPLIAVAAVAMWALLPARWLELRGPLAAAMAVFVALYPARVVFATLEGLQEHAFLGRTNTIAWATGTIVTVLLVLAGLRLWAVTLGWAVTQVVQAAGWVLRFRSRHRALMPRRVGALAPAEMRAVLRQSGWVSVSQLTTVLVGGTDLFIIGHILGPAALVPYTLTAKLVSVLQNQPMMLMHVALPGIAELRGRGDRESLLRVVRAVTLGLLIGSGGVVAVVMLVNRGFVGWWVGTAQYGGDALTFLLLATMLLRHYKVMLVMALFALGDERRSALLNLLDGVVSVALAVIAVRMWGPVGAPIAALVSAALVCIPLLLRALAREMNLGIPALVAPLYPFAWRFIMLFGVAAAIAFRWVPVRFAAIALVGAAAGAVYAAVMYPVAATSVLAPYLDRMRASLRELLGLGPAAVPRGRA